MAMSSDATTADLRAQLEQERDELRHRLAELGFADGGTGLDYDANFADSSQVTAERGEAEALAATLRETLSEVEHALAKFEDGHYGVCESCGKPIAENRLEAMPAARLCIECASKR
jgi:DnaK suppressor protein